MAVLSWNDAIIAFGKLSKEEQQQYGNNIQAFQAAKNQEAIISYNNDPGYKGLTIGETSREEYLNRLNAAYDRHNAEVAKDIERYTILGKILKGVKASFHNLSTGIQSKYGIKANNNAKISEFLSDQNAFCDGSEFTKGVSSVSDAQMAYDNALSKAVMSSHRIVSIT